MDSAIANWATFVSVVFGICVFWYEKRRERADREYGTYHALDEKYAEYLMLCAKHPELDLYLRPLSAPKVLTEEDQSRQLAYFEILVSLFERAYLMYLDHPSKMRAAQWKGWDTFIRQWVRRPLFRSLWGRVGIEQFDTRFGRYIELAFVSEPVAER